MKTKVKIIGNPPQCKFKDGEEGYIDGYVQAADTRPYAVVIIGCVADLVPLHSLLII